MKRWPPMLRIVVLLILGAIVNVAVALALWKWGERPLRGTFESVDAWGRRPWRNADLDAWRRFAADDWPQPLGDECMSQSFFGTRFSLIVAARNDFDASELSLDEWVQKARLRTLYMLEVAEFGWPLSVSSLAEARVTTGMPPSFTTKDDAWQLGPYRLPRPILGPGFAINTVFYAVILWLLFSGPFVVRRRRRIKRGLCPKCAYDLRGSKDATACPECGATR